MYKQGVGKLLRVSRSLVASPQKRRVQSVAEKYVAKAEAIKRKLLARNGTPSRNPPASPSADPSASTPTRDMVTADTGVRFSDIVGLGAVKAALREAVILPATRPDLFTGLRKPPKGFLLFGPPGTGKTMLAKALAAECKASFFSISASSIVSKYMGEGEAKVRALFEEAHRRRPSVIFIDEVDSVLSKRGSAEHEASRRLKTEFLVQLDGVGSKDGVFVLAATNLPGELDDALLRRLPKRFYVPLPDANARQAIVRGLLAKHKTRHTLKKNDFSTVSKITAGYSASDVANVVRDAAMGPLRGISPTQLQKMPAASVPPITIKHFRDAAKAVTKSVDDTALRKYQKWAAANDAGPVEAKKRKRGLLEFFSK